MAERVAAANGIEIAYEEFGEAADPTMLLIMGLGCRCSAGTRSSAGCWRGEGFAWFASTTGTWGARRGSRVAHRLT